MSKQLRYLLDADSFIRSKRDHYAFDICPGYWDALLRAFRQKQVSSIVPVRNELLRGKDALADWVKEQAPESFFEVVTGQAVQTAYANVIQWVQDSEQYKPAEKRKFASGADPWLVAVASTKCRVLVTYEVAGLGTKSKVKLPDVARQFKVECIQPFTMLRQLGVILTLRRDAKKSDTHR